ncbi:hypothetical protein Sjap_025903 [Stephania japonica]|uniref:Uncharacterized protein n=1 Tax=Stephania japonica TaxID=461633 RepID=A0AAP0E612_9MAGN
MSLQNTSCSTSRELLTYAVDHPRDPCWCCLPLVRTTPCVARPSLSPSATSPSQDAPRLIRSICLGMRAQPHSQIFTDSGRARMFSQPTTWQPLVRLASSRQQLQRTRNRHVSAPHSQHVTRSPLLQSAAATLACSSFSANHAVRHGRVQKNTKK